MKGKTTAVLLAGVLVTPVGLAGTSRADGGNHGRPLRSSSSGSTTKIEVEAEMRFSAPGVRAEAEVEWEQGTRNGATRTKLSAEVEVVVAGTTPPALGQPHFVLSGGESCDFVNPPILASFVYNGQTYQLAEFRGAIISAGGLTTPKGLLCSAVPTTAPTTVDVTVSGTPAITFPQGVFVND